MTAPTPSTVTDEIPQQLVFVRFSYEPETGVVTWRRRPLSDFATANSWSRWNNMYACKEAGSLNMEGYRHVRISPHYLKIHRIAWLLFYGAWPIDGLDHINGNRSDNRISNLRQASHEVNGKNRRLSSNNKSGQIGVFWSDKYQKWVATIRNEKHQIHLGRFDEFEKAKQARRDAERKFGFHPNHGSSQPLPSAPKAQGG